MSRNEPARARRRQDLRQKLSLRSIPLEEAPVEKYNLENHFGWQVLQKCKIGDGSFPPYLLHCIYCDKPEMSGREDGDREVYVLYVRGEDGKLEPVDVKETQTAFSTTNTVSVIQHSKPATITKKEERGVVKRPPRDRRRLMSDFYYIPIKERLIAKYDIRPPTRVQSGNSELGKGKAGKARSKPKSWQLRAGAESLDEESEEEETEEDDKIRKFIENLKKECATCFKQDDSALMDSPENKYLYLPSERYERRNQNENIVDTNDK